MNISAFSYIYLYFSSTRVGYRYYLTQRPLAAEQEHRAAALYVSLPDHYTVLRVKDLDNPSDIERYSPTN